MMKIQAFIESNQENVFEIIIQILKSFFEIYELENITKQ